MSFAGSFRQKRLDMNGNEGYDIYDQIFDVRIHVNSSKVEDISVKC